MGIDLKDVDQSIARGGEIVIPPSFRYELRPEDPEQIRHLTRATGFFTDAEVRVAEELAQERLLKGSESGYHFVMVDGDDKRFKSTGS